MATMENEQPRRRVHLGRGLGPSWLGAWLILATGVFATAARADVPTGSEEGAKKYYRSISTSLAFSTPVGIFQSTLDDVASYLGYAGVTGADLQDISPAVLMAPNRLLAKCEPSAAPCRDTLRNRDAVVAALGGVPINPDDVLATRFFAPKIMNISIPEPTRPLGWRKLVRLKARAGSAASAHQIESAIILFNVFTAPGKIPVSPGDESVNTQVLLLTERSRVPPPNAAGPPTLYWLDYSPLSKGGKLELALEASFDANELPPSAAGTRKYFVPDGCVACHGNNSRRAMVNYLDTDHWLDRLPTDFPDVQKRGLPLLLDADSNDPRTASYQQAFTVVLRFNREADQQTVIAQPRHDESLAARRWVDLHSATPAPIPPLDRAIGTPPLWSKDNPNDKETLDLLNQYCFRCHGSVKFSVFNKQAVLARKSQLKDRIKADAASTIRMPPDRPLPDAVRTRLRELLK